MPNGDRRLAAVMFTDIVGYAALTQRNESDTMRLLEEHRNLVRPLIASHGGREVKTIGDAFLVEFHSALDALLCAVAIQQTMHDRRVARGDMLSLRIGIHVGDVIETENDILGDAVNIASRIEPLADPGGVCISSQVYDQVRNKTDLRFVSLGMKTLKNLELLIDAYSVRMPWEQSGGVEVPAYAANRIAILPFRNMSPDPNDEYFAEGMTEEIISTVSGISGLKVISRTSVMGYKGTTKKVEDIGRELRVGSVLEGSFRKAGNMIRVTTQLIDVAGDVHLWTQHYDRELDNIFAVQSDVAKQVAEALQVKILAQEKERIERKPTGSTAAYALYLKGRYHLNRRGLDDLKRAMEYFELTVHEDPDFALGYVGISDCCAILRGNWGVEPEAYLERAKAMVGRALELDPDLAEAHAIRGLLSQQEYDQRGAEEGFKRAIQMKPSYASAHLWYFLLLSSQRRWKEAREQIERALELDPLSPVAHADQGGYHLNRKEYDKAIEPFRKSVELGYNPSHGSLAWTYGKMGRFDDMKREYATWVALNRESVPLAELYAGLWVAYFMDDKETITRLLPELESHYHDERGPDAYYVGALHFHIGEKDKGFEWLERSYARREYVLLDIGIDPFFEAVHTDPRYIDLLERLGLG